MIGKRVHFTGETWAAIDLLRRDRRCTFQQLADEAFRELLGKHGRPVALSGQLQASVAGTADGANDNRSRPKR